MNNDIDDIFSIDNEEQLIKKVKRNRQKLNFKISFFSIISALIIIVLCNLILSSLSNKYIDKQFYKNLDIKTIEFQVKYPNKFISKESYIGTGYFKFQSTYEISKRIGNRLLYAGSSSEFNNIYKTTHTKDSYFISEKRKVLDSNISHRTDDAYGLRHLYFLYPYVNYENTINDFNLLNDIDKNKIVEMTLSFDKQYTYEEINNLIDSNLITFYWVDNNGDERKEYCINNKWYESEDSVIGIKSIFYNGDILTNTNDRLNKFKDSIKYFKDNWNPNVNSDINLDDIKINGVVVVGTTDELKTLQNNSAIKHSIIGSIVNKY